MQNPADFQKERLTTHEAAAFIGCCSYTVKHSRSSGKLLGRPAPVFRKLGRKVVYDRATLVAWIEQFEPRPNTAA